MHESAIGPLYISATKNGITAIIWQQIGDELSSLGGSSAEITHTKNAVVQLDEYFAGARTVFDLQLDMQGTEFQKSVWQALINIPYGKLSSYSDIALEINNPKAVRAVGMANGRNLLSIVVPCHRVVGKNGTLTGYSGGLSIKEALLAIERSNSRV